MERENQKTQLANEQAALNQDQADERAELVHKQRDEQTDLRAERIESEARADMNADQAHDEMVEERRLFTAKQDRRIQEAQAQADELRTKSRALSSAKKNRFNDAWRDYQTKRERAAKQVRVDQAASKADWSKTKPETEKSLRELEFSVEELKKSLSL